MDPAQGIQPRALSERSLIDTLRYSIFDVEDIFVDNQNRRWVKAVMVWHSKRRFKERALFDEFVEWSRTLQKVSMHTDGERVIWLCGH